MSAFSDTGQTLKKDGIAPRVNPAALVVVPGGAILFFSERNDAIMLTKRLAACAALVTPGGVVCDVGTDHAHDHIAYHSKSRR